MCGYPANRQTARTVQVYDIASGSWRLGPPLPQPNNHGMAAGLNGRVPCGGTNIGGSHGSLHNQVFFPTVSCD
jgi:hypothetical protein